MQLTKRQEKQLKKVFDDPRKLRKWIDDVHKDMIKECEKQSMDLINQYLDLYSIAVAYTLRYALGLGKKRLPEIMKRIWENVDAFKDDYIDIQDCIEELEENGIKFDTVISGKVDWKFKKDRKRTDE